MKNLEASEYKTYLEAIPFPTEDDEPVTSVMLTDEAKYESYQKGEHDGYCEGRKDGEMRGLDMAIHELQSKRLSL